MVQQLVITQRKLIASRDNAHQIPEFKSIKEEENMTLEQAQKIVGNSPRWAIKNMVFALQLHPWLNTKLENERLQAGKLILKTRRTKP